MNQSMFDGKPKRVIVKGNVDLHGKSVRLPKRAVLDVRQGALFNGKLILEDVEVLCKDTKNIDCILQGTCSNNRLTINNEEYGAYHISVLNSGATATLTSDVVVPKTLKIKCNIEGRGHVAIKAVEGVQVLMSIASSGVTLSNITLLNENDTREQKCYCIHSANVDSITLNCVSVNGGSVYFRNTDDTHYRGYVIQNCTFQVDHSLCNQSFEKQNDVFEFRGIQKVTFNTNRVKAKNVTRVFKTPAGGLLNTPCDDLVFENNEIISECENGKQIFDFYNLTRNVTIRGNTIIAKGHTDVFENKTRGDTSSIRITIEENAVDYGYTLMYFDLSASGDNEIVIRNNRFKSISSANSRTSIQNNERINAKRLYDCDLRNIKSISIDKNSFNGVGVVPGLLFYFENIDNTIVSNNEVYGNWNQIGRFNRVFRNVLFLNNTENRLLSYESVSPILVFSSAEVQYFESSGNSFMNRRSNILHLQNRTIIHEARVEDTTMSAVPIIVKDKSAIKELIK